MTFLGQDDAEFQDGLGWHRNDYSGSFPFWIGEIFDEKRKKMGDRFSSEACEKYVTGFLHGAMNFCGQIFSAPPPVGSRFCEIGTILCIGFSHGAVKFI